jgi:hypothetical protein
VTELDRTWAASQIEAMAEGSLSAEAERRMLAAMDRDEGLEQRVRHARDLRRMLQGLAAPPVPRGLWWRLWQIPSIDKPRRMNAWAPAGLLATAVVVALGIGGLLDTQGPTAEDAAATAAIQDFAIAMAYLQKSTLMASNEVSEAVGSGVLDALAISRGMLDRTEIGDFNGEQEDD